MNIDRKLILFVLAFVMALTYLTYYRVMENDVDVARLNSKAGHISLDNWDEEENSVKLSGEWAYYEGLLVDEIGDTQPSYVVIPENRKKEVEDNYYRFATYVLEVEGLEPDRLYGIFSGSQVTAYNLYVNNQLVMSNGVVGKSIESHESEWKHTSSNFRADANGSALIAIEISNYEYNDGLFWNSIVIGNSDNIHNSHILMMVTNTILIIFFIGLCFILFVGYIRFKLDKSMLLLVVFLLNVSVRMLVTSSRPILLFVNDFPWAYMLRLDYMTGYLFLPIISMFVLELVDHKYRVALRYLSLVNAGLVIVTTLFASHVFYSNLFFPYLWFSAFWLVYLGWLIGVYYSDNGFHIGIMLIVFVNIIVALMNQIFGSMVSYAPVAMLNVIIGLTIIQVIRVYGRIRKNDILAFSALIDQLTGLYNRKYLDEIAERDMKNGFDQEYYIFFMDLDGFKKVNDLYGHDEGDQVLQIIAQRLRGCLRESDVLLRYGGDEFVILAKMNNQELANDLANRIIDRITRDVTYDGKVHQVGISIGISQCTGNNIHTIEACIHASDQAMYEAKRSGGNSYVYS